MIFKLLVFISSFQLRYNNKLIHKIFILLITYLPAKKIQFNETLAEVLKLVTVNSEYAQFI